MLHCSRWKTLLLFSISRKGCKNCWFSTWCQQRKMLKCSYHIFVCLQVTTRIPKIPKQPVDVLINSLMAPTSSGAVLETNLSTDKVPEFTSSGNNLCNVKKILGFMALHNCLDFIAPGLSEYVCFYWCIWSTGVFHLFIFNFLRNS